MTDTPRIEVTVAAPADEVWRALRDPALVRRWHGWDYDGLDDEVRVIFVDGATEEADGHAFVLSDGDRFALRPVPGGTVVTITRPPRGTNDKWEAYYDDITEGWTAFLLQLRYAVERGNLAERRTVVLDGRLRDGSSLPAALGLAAAADLPVGARYQATAATGDTLAGEVFAHAGNWRAYTVDGLGPGLLVVGSQAPSPRHPAGAGLAILTVYAVDAFPALEGRWTAWWASVSEPVTVSAD